MQQAAVQNASLLPPLQDDTVTLDSIKAPTTGNRLRPLLLLLATVVGCGGGEPSGPSGNLSITVVGLPAGSTAAVDVTGPDGYSQTVAGTQTLTQLTPGTYTVTASAVTVGATLYSGNPPSQSLAVGGSAAAARVTYAANVGALFVNINGLPTNKDAAVTVTGPNSYNQAVVTTTNLGGLAPGAYTITAQAVTAAGGGQYTPDQATLSASVVVGATTSKSVAYVPPREEASTFASTGCT